MVIPLLFLSCSLVVPLLSRTADPVYPCELRRRQDASTAPATTIDGTGFAAIQKKLHSSTNLLPSALGAEPYCLLRRDALSRGHSYPP